MYHWFDGKGNQSHNK